MNKNGWGLRVELLIILLFVICLAVACIGANKFGLLGKKMIILLLKNLLLKNNTLFYEGLEDKLRVATREYYNVKYNDNTEDIVIIKLSTLYSGGYISKLYDKNDRECKGYSKVIVNNDTSTIVPYIRCSGYTTSGYERSNE
ncbi:MAG: hypothetical protein L6V81_05390 [Clostridium sp.]|nr:MAG: hypothetical protein L6V81_05390 [Clostridium sp.]